MPLSSRFLSQKMKSLWRIGTQPLRTATAFARLPPDFLLIGAMRCGTTTLHGYMRRHPNVRVGSRKEVHYFDRHYDRGKHWYLGHFPLALERWRAEREGRPFLIGEFTPDYLFHPLASERVKQTLPDARFLVLFRNPIGRAYSHYQRSRRTGREIRSFEDAIAAESARLAEGREGPYDPVHAYLAKGRYAERLRVWFERFPRERFLILPSEVMFRDPAATCRAVSAFLGIPDFDPPRPQRRNSGSYAPMSEETRDWLRDHFRPHNQALYELVGTDFGWD